MSTTQSPAETLGQQAEAVSGKPMSWMDMAARLAPPGVGILAGLAINKGLANRRAAAQQQAAQQAAAPARFQLAANRATRAVPDPTRGASLRHAMSVTSASPSGRQRIRPGQVLYHRRDDL